MKDLRRLSLSFLALVFCICGFAFTSSLAHAQATCYPAMQGPGSLSGPVGIAVNLNNITTSFNINLPFSPSASRPTSVDATGTPTNPTGPLPNNGAGPFMRGASASEFPSRNIALITGAALLGVVAKGPSGEIIEDPNVLYDIDWVLEVYRLTPTGLPDLNNRYFSFPVLPFVFPNLYQVDTCPLGAIGSPMQQHLPLRLDPGNEPNGSFDGLEDKVMQRDDADQVPGFLASGNSGTDFLSTACLRNTHAVLFWGMLIPYPLAIGEFGIVIRGQGTTPGGLDVGAAFYPVDLNVEPSGANPGSKVFINSFGTPFALPGFGVPAAIEELIIQGEGC